MKAIVLLSLLACCLGSPLQDIMEIAKSTGDKIQAKASYGFAVDVSSLLPTSTFSCIKSSGYSVAFIRVYQPNGNGAVDPNGVQNIKNANAAGLGIEIYATPQPQGTKRGMDQFDEMYKYLIQNGISVQAIWLQVTSPINWPNNMQANINLISGFISRARQYGLRVGIYTNWYDWQQITGSWSGWSGLGSLSLWYWNAYGQGVNAASPINFTDLRSFAGFTSAAAKQYSQYANVCGVTVNQNIYPLSTISAASILSKTGKSDDRITVGLLDFPQNH